METLWLLFSLAAAGCACFGAQEIVRRGARAVRYYRWCRVPPLSKRLSLKIEQLSAQIAELEKSQDGSAVHADKARSVRWAASKSLQISELARESRALDRSLLHARIGLELCKWSSRLAACRDADDCQGTVTTLLTDGFGQLAAWQLPEAENSFKQICESARAHVAAKAISLRAHGWILDFWGCYAQAEEEARQAADLSCQIN